MENRTLTDYLLLTIVVWFALLNLYLFKTLNAYRRLTRGQGNLNLAQILESLAKKAELDEKRLNQLSQEISQLEDLNKSNIQKYALIRFNPYEDTGGDQSFVVALLDGKNNGLVVSSLHSRSGTRVYAKKVLAGKATGYQFSKEEKEVVEKACLPNKN